MTGQQLFLCIFGLTVGAYMLGNYIARSIRMKDYGWKLGLMLSTMTMAISVCVLFWPPKLGIDLNGGDILVYQINEDMTRQIAEESGQSERQTTSLNMSALVEALGRRINPSGVSEVVIRPYGESQIEIIIPEVEGAEIERIKGIIVKQGYLKFRIVADRTRNRGVWQLGEAALASNDEEVRNDKYVRGPNVRKVKDPDGNYIDDPKGEKEMVGEWVRLGVDETPSADGKRRFKVVDTQNMLKRELIPGEVEVLMVVGDQRFNVDGGHLRSVGKSIGRDGGPIISFTMTNEGAGLMGHLTSNNLPDKQTGSYAKLGIVMDGDLLSAPRINSTIQKSGIIEGRFTDKEVDSLVSVLHAGRLPAVLDKEPLSENQISPLLGADTIRKGAVAIGIALIAVLLFMLVYYRFAGVIACAALLSTLLLIVAIMILIHGAFTLPGLAGLVLTVGMSVDANVLIFERIREELRRGASLRIAIRNGFSRATTTIVDANLTTLITAAVLYGIGTDQIRGFAVTLFLGIVMSMFTAIFCSRAIFEIAERKRWLRSLSMTSLLTDASWDFLGKRKLAFAFSLTLILIGMAAVVERGRNLLDIDFIGGSSVMLDLKSPMPIAKMRERVGDLATDVFVTGVDVKTEDARTEKEKRAYGEFTVYKIDTSHETVTQLESDLTQRLRDDSGKSLLVSQKMDFTSPKPVGKPDPKDGAHIPAKFDNRLAWASDAARQLAQLDAGEAAVSDTEAAEVTEVVAEDAAAVAEIVSEGEAAEVAAAEEKTTEEKTTEEKTTEEKTTEEKTTESPQDAVPAGTADSDLDTTGFEGSSPAAKTPEGLTYHSVAKVTFGERVSGKGLKAYLTRAAETLGVALPRFEIANPKWDEKSDDTFTDWTVKFTCDADTSAQILGEVKKTVTGAPVWLSSNKIGSKVAGDMKRKAIAAILLCLLGIVFYIWVRFQHLGYGLAAVVALVHDVLITLGAVAVSAWLCKPLGFLLLDEFKISLPIVAAFLTIIGYSLNDTIVVFDRIREVKGKSPELTSGIINTSINQTLSRTLLTSLTTLLVVMILYAMGGQGIHGFAFALLIGVLVGTYSSIFVASPALLWMTATRKSQQGKKKRVAV